MNPGPFVRGRVTGDGTIEWLIVIADRRASEADVEDVALNRADHQVLRHELVLREGLFYVGEVL